MTDYKFEIPTVATSKCTNNSCLNGWIRRFDSDYPCTRCSENSKIAKAAKYWHLNPQTLISEPVQTFATVPVFSFEEGFRTIRAESLIKFPELAEELISWEDFNSRLPSDEFTQADIKAKLDLGHEWLDAAFAELGVDPADLKKKAKHEGPRSRFYRYVTGDFSKEKKQYAPKSLVHPNARYCFNRFIKGTEYKSHMDLAMQIALDNWEALGALLQPGFTPKLLATDDMVGITGEAVEQITEKAFLVTGYGWLPKSKCKFKNGKLWIPAWLDKKAKAKQSKEA
jgi:hypothetical protein